MRADNTQIRTINVSYASTESTFTTYSVTAVWQGAQLVVQYQLQSSIKLAFIKLAGQGSPLNCPPGGSQVSIGGALWYFTLDPLGFCFSKPSIPVNYSGTVALADFSSFLVTTGNLNQYDVELQHWFSIQGRVTGSYSLQFSEVLDTVSQILDTGEMVIGSAIYDSMQYMPDPSSSDYLNTTYAKTSPSMSGIVVDFLYTRAGLNVYIYLK